MSFLHLPLEIIGLLIAPMNVRIFLMEQYVRGAIQIVYFFVPMIIPIIQMSI